MARRAGATHALCTQEPGCIDKVRELTGGGVDYAFELAGSIDAMTTAYALV